MFYKTISSELIHKNFWGEYRHDVFASQNSKPKDYYYFRKTGNVIVVPVLDDGRLLLISQPRYLQSKTSIEFPGGSMDDDESPQVAAQRELNEETGYFAHDLIKIGVFEGLVGLINDPTHVFLAKDLEQQSAPQNTDVEVTEVLPRRVDEMEIMIKRGEIWCGRTLSAWALARQHLIKS